MMIMKGQVALVWLIGMFAIFTLVLVYVIFAPFINQDIGDTFINLSADLDQTNFSQVERTINLVKISMAGAIMVLVVGIILYMIAAMDKEEPHADII